MMEGSFLVLFYNNNKLKNKIYKMNANWLISNNDHTKNALGGEQLLWKRIRRMKRNIWTSTFNHFLNIKIQTEDDEEDDVDDDNEHQKRLNNWITYTPATQIVCNQGFLVPFLLHWNWAKSANWWSANSIETTTITGNRYNNRTTNNEW